MLNWTGACSYIQRSTACEYQPHQTCTDRSFFFQVKKKRSLFRAFNFQGFMCLIDNLYAYLDGILCISWPSVKFSSGNCVSLRTFQASLGKYICLPGRDLVSKITSGKVHFCSGHLKVSYHDINSIRCIIFCQPLFSLLHKRMIEIK